MKDRVTGTPTVKVYPKLVEVPPRRTTEEKSPDTVTKSEGRGSYGLGSLDVS